MPTAPAFVVSLAAFALGAPLTPGSAQAPRPMTFMDQQLMRQAGGTALSPDGNWMVYTISVPNWKEAKRYTDIYVGNPRGGLSSTRQVTLTDDKNQNAPRWLGVGGSMSPWVW